MKQTGNKFSNQAGVSIVELIIVCLIVAVVSTVALMRFGTSRPQLERQNVARELKVAFERARFDSVKRRALTAAVQASVVVQANSFTLKTDINRNGTLEANEDRINTSWSSGLTIRAANGGVISSPITVTFNNRGETIVTGAASAAFLICNGDCSTPSASSSNLVSVTATGTVNLQSGGATIPIFTPPGVAAVNSNADVRSETKLN